MFLLTALIVKNSHVLAGIYFIFLKTLWTKLKSRSIPILDLTEKIGKVVIKSDKFYLFLQLSVSNLKLKLCENTPSCRNITKI